MVTVFTDDSIFSVEFYVTQNQDKKDKVFRKKLI